MDSSQESEEIEGEISSVDNNLKKLCWERKERGRVVGGKQPLFSGGEGSAHVDSCGQDLEAMEKWRLQVLQ